MFSVSEPCPTICHVKKCRLDWESANRVCEAMGLILGVADNTNITYEIQNLFDNLNYQILAWLGGKAVGNLWYWLTPGENNFYINL